MLWTQRGWIVLIRSKNKGEKESQKTCQSAVADYHSGVHDTSNICALTEEKHPLQRRQFQAATTVVNLCIRLLPPISESKTKEAESGKADVWLLLCPHCLWFWTSFEKINFESTIVHGELILESNLNKPSVSTRELISCWYMPWYKQYHHTALCD